MTEANLETGVPQVSAFKLGKLEKVSTNSSDRCLLSVVLRKDFCFDEAEEAEMKQLHALAGTKGYKGGGTYVLALTDFFECFVEV